MLRTTSLMVLMVLLLVIPETGKSAERPNVLFIAIDDLRNDLGALGVEYAQSPQLDAFAETARVFPRHYTQVPTCGASRCALMRGCYPDQPAHLKNQGIAATHRDWGARSLPAVFKSQGYRTLALGKVTHHPGGLIGANWANGPEELPGAWDRSWVPESPWKTPQAMMHGFADGVPRQRGVSPAFEAFDGPDTSYPDAWVADEAIRTLDDLSRSDQPWFFAVGFFKPHLPFAAPKRFHDLHTGKIPDLSERASAKPTWKSNWHGSGEFRGNYGHTGWGNPATNPEYATRLREAYAACVSYMDSQVGRLLDAVNKSGLAENTIVVLWSDHGFLLGEHAIWGKHCLYENALKSPLMIRTPDLPEPGVHCQRIVETIDLFPTLVDLCGLPAVDGLDGQSLRPLLDDPHADLPDEADWALGFWGGGRRTVRTDRWRLIENPGSGNKQPVAYELFDYESDPLETRNHAADHPDVVRELEEILSAAPMPANR